MAFRNSVILCVNLNKKTFNKVCLRSFSIEGPKNAKDHYKLLVIGGGSGGLATSSRFARKLDAQNVAIVEPAEWHCKKIKFFTKTGKVKFFSFLN